MEKADINVIRKYIKETRSTRGRVNANEILKKLNELEETIPQNNLERIEQFVEKESFTLYNVIDSTLDFNFRYAYFSSLPIHTQAYMKKNYIEEEKLLKYVRYLQPTETLDKDEIGAILILLKNFTAFKDVALVQTNTKKITKKNIIQKLESIIEKL